MKRMYRNIDTETVFYEDELKKAIEYYSNDSEDYSGCESLQELADTWNSNNAGNAIGEMIVEAWNENDTVKYFVADREAGNLIEEVASIQEGLAKIAEYEEVDKKNGTYTPNFYEVEDENHYRVEV